MKKYFQKLFIWIIIIFFTGISYVTIDAQTINELENQIKERTQERIELEQQAERIRQELNQVGAEKGTLNSELNRINAERKSLENTIKQTENEINALDLKINKSEKKISSYENEIKNNIDTLGVFIRGIDQQNRLSFLEVISSAQYFSDFFKLRDTYLVIQRPLLTITNLLKKSKLELRKTNFTLEEEQGKLEEEQNILDDQRSIVKLKESEKVKILNKTKQKESTVRKNLIETLAIIDKLDAEIRDFESKIEFALNPNSIPKRGSVVFDWPLSKVLITQRFGKTTSSGRLYLSGSHSGNDFRAAMGTPVYAVADGKVLGTGNTDIVCPRASFGKWVFIEHQMGLSTTYGHLSKIVAVEGQNIKKGDLIAYSGNTGYSTAPHLHLTTYATKGINGEKGVRITNRESKACSGKTYTMPLAPTAAYLDPLDYLPETNSTMFKHPSLAG